MNDKLKLLLTALIVFIAAPISGFSTEKKPTNGDGSKQEEIKQEENKQEEAKEDTIGIYEYENKVNDGYQLEDQLLLLPQEPVISERTTTSYTSNPQDSNKEDLSEEDPNSAMSFNFIYYIIDKFKLADPLD